MNQYQYPPMYSPKPGVVTAEEYYERHIVDLGDLGYRLQNYLTVLFKDNNNYQEIVRFVYTESFAQMVLSMDYNHDEFCLRLIALPNFEIFAHIYEFSIPQIKEEFTQLFKQIALELFDIIYQTTNPMGNRAQYFADATSLSYIVVIKSFEPGMLQIPTNL